MLRMLIHPDPLAPTTLLAEPIAANRTLTRIATPLAAARAAGACAQDENLENISEVLKAAKRVTADYERAIFWFATCPLAEFQNQTAKQLVGTGRTDAVLRYLNALGAGSSG